MASAASLMAMSIGPLEQYQEASRCPNRKHFNALIKSWAVKIVSILKMSAWCHKDEGYT